MALGDLIIHIRHSHADDMWKVRHFAWNSSKLPSQWFGISCWDPFFYSLNGQDAATVEAPQVESWDGSNGLPHPVFTSPGGEVIGGEFSGYNGDCAHGGLAYDQQQKPPLPNLHKDEDGVNYQLSRWTMQFSYTILRRLCTQAFYGQV